MLGFVLFQFPELASATVVPSFQVAKRLSSVNFTCVTYGDPKPQILWSYEGGSLPSEVEFVQQNQTIIIDRVMIKHEGTYTCTAVNAQGNESSSAELKVEGKIKLRNVL